ncbi:hypothetical protein ABFA07_009671 [Porites harrisoni]
MPFSKKLFFSLLATILLVELRVGCAAEMDEPSSFLERMGAMHSYDATTSDQVQHSGIPGFCVNKNSDRFCKRFKSYCGNSDERNRNYMKERCAWECGCV